MPGITISGRTVPTSAAAAVLGVTVVFLSRRKFINWLYNVVARVPKSHPGQDYLSENFAPVDKEVHVINLQVEGSIPKELEGAFLRIGPNPALSPVAGYHWFDGDGMVHCTLLKDGKAQSYSNSWVRTARFKREQQQGAPIYRKSGDLYGLHGLLLLGLDGLKRKLGCYNDKEGTGTANTAMYFHAGRILALHEGDLPYQIRVTDDGHVETVGRLKLGGKDGQPVYPGPFTAHPKIDSKTGEMFFFGYKIAEKPFARAGMMDPKGEVTKQWKIDLPYGAMMHDCAMTANYAVILHLPLVFDPKKLVKERQAPLDFKPELPGRVGLLRRDAPGSSVNVLSDKAPAAPVQWFEMPSCFAFHVANAWEDKEGRVHVIICHFPKFGSHGLNNKEATQDSTPQDERQVLYEYLLDPATGQATQTKLSDQNVDFPVVNPATSCHQNRYVWAAHFNHTLPSPDNNVPDGVCKFDLSVPAGSKDACVGTIALPQGVFGGETIFVQRPASASGQTPEEDDGWLLTYVHDNNTNRSALHIYDGKTMDSKPLAKIAIPQRVPVGFHAQFVPARDLQRQL